MARPKTAAPYKRSITVKVTDEMIDVIEGYLKDPSAISKWMLSQVINGCQLTIKPDFKTGGISASIMPIDSSDQNAGIMLFANGDDLLGAIACLAAKVDSLPTDTPWVDADVVSNTSRYS